MTISIAMCTYNGANYLEQQLESIAAQKLLPDELIICDDNSTDRTHELISHFSDSVPFAVRLVKNKRRLGVVRNFEQALSLCTGTYIAFCDQDDVWHPTKLARALDHIAPYRGPSLYSAGRHVTDADLNILETQLRSNALGLVGTLLRNRVAGHTCVLSPDAVTVLKQRPPGRNVPFHDWWAALVLRAHGATFIHDPTPVLSYRQHSANVLGARGGRWATLLTGRYFKWVWANLRALRACRK